jgi:predicted TIM-barrel fold metal-dependent hydrolase
MVIDFHTHAFPDTIAKRAIAGLVEACGGIYEPCTDGTQGDLKKKMADFGVDISVVQPVVTKPSQTKTVNEWAREITGDKLISFGGIHPATDDYKRDIDFICSLGLPGIKLHPEYQNFVVDAPEMLKIYDYAFSKGLMILFHAGYDPAFPPPYKSSPKQFAKIKKELQGGTVIAAHLGSARMWEDVEEHLAGSGIYIDTSMGFEYYPHDLFMKIVEAVGEDYVLFGSDSPWSRAGQELETLKTLPLSPGTMEKILYKNAAKLLNL